MREQKNIVEAETSLKDSNASEDLTTDMVDKVISLTDDIKDESLPKYTANSSFINYQDLPENFYDAIKKSAKTINNWPDRDDYVEIIQPTKRLYKLNGHYFETLDEVLMFCRENKISIVTLMVFDYYKNLYGFKDVIRKMDSYSSTFYKALSKDKYNIYNGELNRKNMKWSAKEGSISSLYDIFRNYGVVFDSDAFTNDLKENELRLKP